MLIKVVNKSSYYYYYLTNRGLIHRILFYKWYGILSSVYTNLCPFLDRMWSMRAAISNMKYNLYVLHIFGLGVQSLPAFPMSDVALHA